MLAGSWRVTSLPVPSGILARLMQAASPSSQNPAGAGGLLLAVLVAAIGAGVLLGWAAGSPGLGALFGALIGILGGIYAVYRRYRRVD
jgi:F0F1-type ATP synthase assembly protein I